MQVQCTIAAGKCSKTNQIILGRIFATLTPETFPRKIVAKPPTKKFFEYKNFQNYKTRTLTIFLQCQTKSFRELLLDTHCDIIFSVEKHFPKEIIQFSSRRFFLFLQPPMTRRVQVCRVVDVLHNTCPGCQRGLEAGGGGFDTGYRPYFLTSF